MRRDRRCQEPLRSRTCERWVGNGTGDAEPHSEECQAASRQLGGQGTREGTRRETGLNLPHKEK